jgi:hypothetical protein
MFIVSESGIIDLILGDSMMDINKKLNKIGGKKVSKVFPFVININQFTYESKFFKN